jgi:hypothetical protein
MHVNDSYIALCHSHLAYWSLVVTPSQIHSELLLSGCKNKRVAPVLRDIIQTEYFRVVVVDDVDAVEVCGALKVSVIFNKTLQKAHEEHKYFKLIVL